MASIRVTELRRCLVSGLGFLEYNRFLRPGESIGQKTNYAPGENFCHVCSAWGHKSLMVILALTAEINARGLPDFPWIGKASDVVERSRKIAALSR